MIQKGTAVTIRRKNGQEFPATVTRVTTRHVFVKFDRIVISVDPKSGEKVRIVEANPSGSELKFTKRKTGPLKMVGSKDFVLFG